MSKNTDFFRCFSINLHKFLKVSGIQAMNDGEHTDGINIKVPDGEWQSFPNLYEASKQTGLSLKHLKDIHEKLQAQDERSIADDEGYEYSKRVRKFWVYLVNADLEKALRKWKETGPKS